ncbi:hypothetical protein GC105_16550 [Alkalibaculum sp. M08DMB]|uniref:Carbonic anhydrase n=1 Tax=Alkalibaculum sporogenes TaxID=2655001 RepID=A0A6A7KDF8_9FIRM|nr:carbonic anhydrase [Alkalibaculum sporogenes]MPW27366.1 hypothetical protein [Alkalibaculum sporogenes]
MGQDIFVTTINCMDGRIQVPVLKYMSETYNANFVDNITETGPNGILAANQNNPLLHNLKRRLHISVNLHGSRVISIVGHHDCAGNTVDYPTQIEHIKMSIKTLKSWNLNVDEIIGLWVNENWQISLISIE